MNIIDYIKENQEVLKKENFNEIDGLILSQLAYIRFENIPHRKRVKLSAYGKMEYFKKMFCDDISDDKNEELFINCILSPRFRNIKILDYKAISTEEEQFAGFLFAINGIKYLAFRGTDGNMSGWKENFTLAYNKNMPAQVHALEYLKKLNKFNKIDYIGGHSKGGNLAVYSSLLSGCGIPTYCFDGPGFSSDFKLTSENIHKYIPEASVVGCLLSTNENVSCVKSSSSLIMQHSAFSWEIENNRFVSGEQSSVSKYIEHSLSNWLKSISNEEKEIFVETLFHTLSENNISTVKDLKEMSKKDFAILLGSFGNASPEIRNTIKALLRELQKESVRQILPQYKISELLKHPQEGGEAPPEN